MHRPVLHSLLRSHRLVVAMCVLVALPAFPLGAQDITLQSAGGTGGDPFTISCAPKVMVGVGGQGGSNIVGAAILYNVYLWCVELEADGRWSGTPSKVTTPSVGKPGPSNVAATDLKCPSNTAVSGIGGRAGGYVWDIELRCSTIGEHGYLTGGPQNISGNPQLSGSSMLSQTVDPTFGTFLCPQNLPGKSLTGRAHDWLDQLALTCGLPTAIKPPFLVDLALPASAVGGTDVAASVTLNGPTPSDMHLTINTSPSGIATVPPVTILAGQEKARFTFKTSSVGSSTTLFVNITTTQQSFGRFTTLLPPSLKALSAPHVTSGASTVAATVSLDEPAFAGGLALQLSSSDPSVATVPATVVIAQGDTSGNFAVTVPNPNSSACAVIRADYNGTRKTAPLAITPTLGRTTLTKLPLELTLGTGSQLIVSLSSPTTSAATISLVSSNPAVFGVPPTATIPAGAASTKVGLTVTPNASACASIRASTSTQTSTLVLLADGGVVKAP